MKKNIFKKYIRNTVGVVAVWFGMSVPLVVSAVGVSVDLGQSYLVKERLSQALDAAALAAASMSSEDESVIEAKVNDFIDANYPPDKIGYKLHVDVNSTSDKLFVSATARLNTSFMKTIGVDTIDVYAETEVTKEVKSIEVSLVMDVTGSMSKNNNIATLRTAATDFVDIMFDRVKDINQIKIGLVPFSTSVNVGPYGLGKTPTGLNYDTPFVNNPSNLEYSATDTKKWMGCILEGEYPLDVEDHEGPWDMYRYCRTSTGAVIPNCDTNYNRTTKVYTARREQNYICPRTPIVPLTNNKTELKASIASLKASGNTYINTGLMWGYRMLSPDFPLTEGVSWNNEDWKKAIILMTDGVNVMHNFYSVYGPTANHNIKNSDLDNRVLEVCDALKEKDVLLYTITFESGVSNYTKSLFENCATQPSMWYHAPSKEKLIEVYQTIAKELSNLHLSK